MPFPDFLKSAVSHRASVLVDQGVITISAFICQDGYELWARTTRPIKAVASPHQSFPVEELVEMIDNLKTVNQVISKGPVDTSATGAVVPSIPPPMDLKTAIQLNAGKRLEKVKIHGVMNQLSPDSLHYRDLLKNYVDFEARAVLVANKIGLNKAAARIATNKDLFLDSGETLPEWWARASPEMRWQLLTVAKKVGSPGSGDRALMIKTMQNLQCPFRDSEKGDAKESEEIADILFGKEEEGEGEIST